MHRQHIQALQHASRVLGDWIGFYSNQHPHQALGIKHLLRHLLWRLELGRNRWVISLETQP
ncbi:hypothetical protein [Duganella sp. CF458]|uniref:hypothetical protein n=1 Tax=Duganella sp. CF458 TaxID=1884368 RepID=UPI001B8BA07E|nr:hypothetical protein [Duganella sp. CF458]